MSLRECVRLVRRLQAVHGQLVKRLMSLRFVVWPFTISCLMTTHISLSRTYWPMTVLLKTRIITRLFASSRLTVDIQTLSVFQVTIQLVVKVFTLKAFQEF